MKFRRTYSNASQKLLVVDRAIVISVECLEEKFTIFSSELSLEITASLLEFLLV